MDGQTYEELQFKPEMAPIHGSRLIWDVWCGSGALQVLHKREYLAWIRNNPLRAYLINFANGASATIDQTHPLWVEMTEIAKDCKVEVLAGDYIPWTGEADSLRRIRAIRISSKDSCLG